MRYDPWHDPTRIRGWQTLLSEHNTKADTLRLYVFGSGYQRSEFDDTADALREFAARAADTDAAYLLDRSGAVLAQYLRRD